MPNISQHTAPATVQAIYDWFVKQRGGHRPHLGGSQVGHSCDRYLWYQFHWCESPTFDGRMLRLFDHGNVEETRLVRDLRHIGVIVYDIDPETNRQILYTAFGGHFGLSLDGVGKGLPEAPHKWHTLEFKTVSEKRYATLPKKGLEKWSPVYWAQVQIGMELSGIDRCYFLATNKNTDAIYGERIRHKAKEGQRLLNRAEKVIFSEEPLERVSERPDWYECKFCDMYQLCHQRGTAEVNCRTCLHSTAERDGTWSCAKHEKTLTVKEQRAGCDAHLFRPQLTGHGEAVDAGTDYVEYRNDAGTFRNGPPGPRSYTSKEMRAANELPLDEGVEKTREVFDGELVENNENGE